MSSLFHLFTHTIIFFSLFLCKINSFLSFLLSSPHFCDWCASPSLCAWRSSAGLCFCSCLFPNLLMIAKLLTSSPPIKAWASPLLLLLSISLVSTLVPLLPTLILGPIGRWVWEDGKEHFFRSWMRGMSSKGYKESLWKNRHLRKKMRK